MSRYETTTVTVAAQQRGDDRIAVRDFDDGVVIVVADGAGGTGGGAQAADAVIREVTAAADLAHDAAKWCEILRQTDLRIGSGEATCVVAAWTAAGVVGASVGDSRAWLLDHGELTDLTKDQVRKPLLGSGDARPVGFTQPAAQGLLLVATDGFCNYVRRDVLLKEIHWIDFAVLARKLVELVRLPSGDLWDDIGIVACRPRRMTGRRRYELGT